MSWGHMIQILDASITLGNLHFLWTRYSEKVNCRNRYISILRFGGCGGKRQVWNPDRVSISVRVLSADAAGRMERIIWGDGIDDG